MPRQEPQIANVQPYNDVEQSKARAEGKPKRSSEVHEKGSVLIDGNTSADK